MNVVSIALFSYIITNNQVELISDNARYQSQDLVDATITTISDKLPKEASQQEKIDVLAKLLQEAKGKYILFRKGGKALYYSDSTIQLPVDADRNALKASSTKEYTGKNYFLEVNTQQRLIHFYLTMDFLGMNQTYLYIQYKLDEIGKRFRDLYQLIFITIAVVTILHILFAFIIYKLIIAPIIRLTGATRRVAQGDYETNIHLERFDEIGDLFWNFNTMTQMIQKNIDALNDKMFSLQKAKKKIEKMAVTDELTGLFNRRHLFDEFDRLLDEAEKRDLNLGFIILDIDFFKKVNDTYGHTAGDEILRSVSKVLREFCDQDEVITSRYGGEEMVIVIPGENIDTCINFAEHLRKEIASTETPVDNEQVLKVTVSIGVSERKQVSQFYKGDLTSQKLIEFADEALYRSKEAGRNQVQWAKPGK